MCQPTVTTLTAPPVTSRKLTISSESRIGTILELFLDMLDADSSSLVRDAIFSAHSLEAPALTVGGTNPEPLEASARDLVSVARRVLAAMRGGPAPSARARAELAQARHLLEALGAALEANDVTSESLAVADDGTWFQTPQGRVDVARRGAVRRILVALARARVDSSLKALTVDELFEIGWPGERIPYESQVRRVYTAVWTLRTLGLEGMLLTRDEGYLLDPKRAVRLAA